MMLHRNAATAAASRASGQATNADFHRPVAVVIIACPAGKGQGRQSGSAVGQHTRALASYYGFQCSVRFIPATSG